MVGRAHVFAAVLTAALMGAGPSAAGSPVELPGVWAGLTLGMTLDAFDRIVCAVPGCRSGRVVGSRVSYSIDPGKAQALDILPGSRVRFTVRWATFIRGRMVGFRAAPAGALSVFQREALTTHVWQRFGAQEEPLEWCGRRGEDLSYEPTGGWLALHQIKSNGDLDGDEAIDSFCLLDN
jgi:hypothetical protein